MLLLSLIAGAQATDLVVTDIDVECSTVTVTVANQSPLPAPAFYIDVFRDEPAPPPMGSIGDQYVQVSGLPPFGRTSRSFNFFDPGWEGWIDVLLDTGEDVTEFNESNNHEDLYTEFVCHPS